MGASYMIKINKIEASQINKYMLMDCFNEKTKESAKQADILFLPDLDLREGIDRAFQPDTLTFYKYVRQKNNDFKVGLFENEGEAKTLTLHSFDIWLPTIWIASSIALPFVINLASSYVYDRLKGREKEEVTVQLNVVIEDKKKGKSASIFYKGPGQGLKESFEKIDINKIWED